MDPLLRITYLGNLEMFKVGRCRFKFDLQSNLKRVDFSGGNKFFIQINESGFHCALVTRGLPWGSSAAAAAASISKSRGM
jgi:hypothetical protein